MRYITGLIGLILVFFGNLLMSITDSDLTTNITLKTFGIIYFIIGLKILFSNINSLKKSNNQDDD